ncbi:MAG: hypothetical protein Q9222_003046 [Ikaeria aurantiellina]
MAARILILLGLVALAAAQRCQNYWNGRAPFCAPGGCASDAYRWWGIVSDAGNGAQCLTGHKRLCQCLATGSLDACVPTVVPPKESEHLNGLFTTCNNGCSAYVCSVKWVKFWKREEEGSMTPTRKVHMRFRTAFTQIEYGSLAGLLRSLGENTDGKSQADLVNAAWSRFEAEMGNLDLGQVNAMSSLYTFEQGSAGWIYYGDRIAT